MPAALLAAALFVSIAAIGLLAAAIGRGVDLTILYLAPLLAATYLLGMRWGLAAGGVAAVSWCVASLLAPGARPPAALADALLHALVFASAVIGMATLLRELRKIRRLEGLRDLDLETARAVHENIVGSLATGRDDLDLASRLWFLREVGGDYYWFEDVDERRSFLCVGDISGKGVVAALFTALLDESVRTGVHRSPDVTTVVRHVNRRVCDSLPSNMFVTLFAALIDGDMLTFINAGHEPALLWRRRAGTIDALQTEDGLPLGVASEVSARPKTVRLEPGDVLLVVTDGVTESARIRQDGRGVLSSVLHASAAAGHSAGSIVERVFALARPDEDADSTDDIAVVCMRVSTLP